MRGMCGLSRVQNVGVGTIARIGVGVEETGRGAPDDTVGRAGHGRQMMQIHARSGWNGWSAPSAPSGTTKWTVEPVTIDASSAVFSSDLWIFLSDTYLSSRARQEHWIELAITQANESRELVTYSWRPEKTSRCCCGGTPDCSSTFSLMRIIWSW